MSIGYTGQDLISVKGIGKEFNAEIFRIASDYKAKSSSPKYRNILEGKIITNLFYEPSTRTSASFAAAMHRLGGNVLSINDVQYSSVSKGESLEDTIRTLECYSDAIVLRHPEIGAAKIAADVASKPIISAGDGAGEHPTQALIDLFTIREEIGSLFNGMNVALVGDLKYGRTSHSLARLLSLYNVNFSYVAPSVLQMPESIQKEVSANGRDQKCFERIEDIIENCDVLYMTRIQKERLPPDLLEDYLSLKEAYTLDAALMAKAKEKMAVLHPFPRVGEIAQEVDGDNRAAYFRQIQNGLYVRMAILTMILK